MDKFMVSLLVCLFFPSLALAQYEPPSTELTPYEQQRYGSTLSEVPREPYQGRYTTEKYNSGIYEFQAEPDNMKRSGKRRSGGDKSPIQTAPSGRLKEDKSRQRFQERMQWENEQRKISERSRYSPPVRPREQDKK